MATSAYTVIAADEFEDALPPAAEEVACENTDERVWGLPLPSDDLSVRVFSTVEGEASRGYGEDAIRCVIWSEAADGPVGGETKTLRTHGWDERVTQKLGSLYADWRSYDHGECPECGEGVLCERTPGQGDDWSPFLACSSWNGGAGCEYTEWL